MDKSKRMVGVRTWDNTVCCWQKTCRMGVSNGELQCGGGRGSRMGSILGRGGDNWREERKGVTGSRGVEGGVMTSRHCSHKAPCGAHTRMKQCPPEAEHSARQLPSKTTHVCRRLWRSFPRTRQRPNLPSHSCGTAVLRHCGSTSTMGTSMVDEYPTLFRDSLLFGLFCLPSLTFS
jgi:hypothetical protein